jgi:DnaK suppressor protein
MNDHEEISRELKRRLSELRTHLVKIGRELHKKLPADSEDQAIELENQEALEVIEKTETTEIREIEAALERISQGAYATCARCGAPIDPRRLKALPSALACIPVRLDLRILRYEAITRPSGFSLRLRSNVSRPRLFSTTLKRLGHYPERRKSK